MFSVVHILISSSLLSVVSGGIYPYVSRYNWIPNRVPPPAPYNNDAVSPPCAAQDATPCPDSSSPTTPATEPPSTTAPDTTVSAEASTTTVTASSTAAPTTTGQAPSTAAPSTSTQSLPDCISDGGGICTASCNIGTFTEQDSSYSCEGNGLGSVCCLEPLG